MTTTYAISATAEVTETDHRGQEWKSARQVPTFYLDARVQGITSEAAAKSVAYRILTIACDSNVRFHVTAVAL